MPEITLTDRFREALCYAAALHADQRRKVSGEPYLVHLLAVAAIVLEHGGDEKEAIAALLHDAIEDQGGTARRDDIAKRFGHEIAQTVDALSDSDATPKPPWRARKEAYLARLRRAAPSVRLISAADKLHNARSLVRAYRTQGESLWQHFRGGRDGTLWYYRAVVDALHEGGDHRLLDELDRTVAELENLVS